MIVVWISYSLLFPSPLLLRRGGDSASLLAFAGVLSHFPLLLQHFRPCSHQFDFDALAGMTTTHDYTYEPLKLDEKTTRPSCQEIQDWLWRSSASASSRFEIRICILFSLTSREIHLT